MPDINSQVSKQIYSIGFPKIFSGSRINLSKGRDAIKASN